MAAVTASGASAWLPPAPCTGPSTGSPPPVIAQDTARPFTLSAGTGLSYNGGAVPPGRDP